MKRLLLMGGRPWFAEDGGKKFVETLLQGHPQEAKMAFCLFAQPEERWEEVRKLHAGMIDSHKGSREVVYQTITKENFTEVSAWADIIFLPGGRTVPVQEIMNCGDIGTLWDGKLIAGSSAGADLFCEGYIAMSTMQYGRGLGWIKATFIPHWRSAQDDYPSKDWAAAEQTALDNSPDTPVLRVPEEGFVEFTVA